MRFKGRGIIIAALIGLFVVLLNRKAPQLNGHPNFTLLPIGSSGFELQSDLNFYNPNFLSATIKDIHEEVYVNGHLVSIVNMGLDQGIPGRKETKFPMTVRFEKKALITDFPDEELMENKPVEIHVTGHILYSNLVGGDSLHIDLKDTVMVKLPTE